MKEIDVKKNKNVFEKTDILRGGKPFQAAGRPMERRRRRAALRLR